MGKISTFITGASLGAIAALLLAPKTGEQARAFVAEKANAVAGEAKDFGAGVPGTVQDVCNTIRNTGADFLKDAPAAASSFAADAASRVKEATGQAVPAQDSDELREKIEAARQRIAAQVMENAEQSKALNVEPAETAVETVEDAAE